MEKGNTSELIKSVDHILQNRVKFAKESCINRSELFSNKNYYDYVELYKKITL